MLNATICHHIECYKQSRPLIANKLSRFMYVDDVISGSNSIEESVELYTEFRDMLSKGGFNLRKFVASKKENIENSESPGELCKELKCA